MIRLTPTPGGIFWSRRSQQDAVATLARGDFAVLSATRMGISHADDGLIWGDATAETRAMNNLTALGGIDQLSHDQGFGMRALSTWDGVNGPMPTFASASEIDFWGASVGGTELSPWPNSLDGQVQRMMAIGGEPCIILYYWPWFLGGVYNTSTGVTTPVDPPNTIPGVDTNFGYNARPRNDRFPYLLNMYEWIVRRYCKAANNPLGLVCTTFIGGQEYKAWTTTPGVGQTWDNRWQDPSTLPHYATDAANMGFGWFWNNVCARARSAAAAEGVTIKFGGPYPVHATFYDNDIPANYIPSTTTDPEWVDHPNNPVNFVARHGKQPYGRFRKAFTRAVIDFFEAVDQGGGGATEPDFFVLDCWMANKKSNADSSHVGWLNPGDWPDDFTVTRAKQRDIQLELEYCFTQAGRDIRDYPIVSAETYLARANESQSEEHWAALQTAGMVEIIKQRWWTPFLWTPWGEAQAANEDAGILAHPDDAANGGNPKAFYEPYAWLNEHFNRGAVVYDLTGNDADVRGVGTRDKILAWNQTDDVQVRSIGGANVTFAAKEVKLIDVEDVTIFSKSGALAFADTWEAPANFIISGRLSGLPTTNNARLSVRKGVVGSDTLAWEIRPRQTNLAIYKRSGLTGTPTYTYFDETPWSLSDWWAVIFEDDQCHVYINWIWRITVTLDQPLLTHTTGYVETIQGGSFTSTLVVPHSAA